MLYITHLLFISNAATIMRDKYISFIIMVKTISIYSIIFAFTSIYSKIYIDLSQSVPSNFKENKGKSGIYMCTHIESGKCYVGSAVDLNKRLKNYFNVS